jgi:lysozyme
LKRANKYLLIGGAIILFLMSNTSAYAGLFSFLKQYEEGNNAALTAYDDGFGTWTIGWGSIYNYDLKRAVLPGDKIDLATANRWLEIEAKSKMDQVAKLLKVTVNNNQLIALSSFAYNVGINALATSTLLKLLNAGSDKVIVANEFDKWVRVNGNVSKGLQNRRKAEKNLFLS